MAQRTIVQLTDDLDGSEGGNIQTVQFAVYGTQYEIDLTEAHRGDLGMALAPYIASARQVNAAPKPRNRTGSNTARNKRIRAWWKSQAPETYSTRGRIPSEITAQYDAAFPGDR